MTYIKEFLNEYAPSMIHSLVLLIFSYTSVEIKKIYKKYIEDKTKKDVTEEVCNAINEMYPNYNNNEKINVATKNVNEILKLKKIIINKLELEMYIKSCFSKLKKD